MTNKDQEAEDLHGAYQYASYDQDPALKMSLSELSESFNEHIISKKTFSILMKNSVIEESYSNSMSELISAHIRELSEKKDAIVIERINHFGFAHLLEGIEKKRFKRITVEQSDTEEKVFVDDGTDEGFCVVTFLRPELEMPDIHDMSRIFTAEIKYY